MYTKRPALVLLCALSLGFSAISTASAADQADTSLEAIWDEQVKPTGTQQVPTTSPGTTSPGATSSGATATPAPASRSSTTSATASPTVSSEPSNSASAPLCTVEAFKTSDFVRKSSWPGIGPFKGATDDDLVDPAKNKLTLAIDKEKITEAELALAEKASSLLKLEMTTDFLLESLGAKPASISEFNGQLEKNKSQIISKSPSNPLNLSAGRFIVAIYPGRAGSTLNDANYVIKVNSKDASSEVIKQSVPLVSALPVGTTPGTTTPISTTPVGTTSGTKTSSSGWNATGVSVSTTTPRATTTTTTTAAKPPSTWPSTDRSTSPSTQSSAGLTMDLKDQFLDLINSWQKIKRVAVRQRDTQELQQVLSGKALNRQSDAIKWLMVNKRYYDMAPRGVIIDRYNEILKDQKYQVFAQVKEASKFIEDATGQVLKDTTDTYNVNYTVEKIGDKWFITDSGIINTTNSPTPAGKPQQASKPTR